MTVLAATLVAGLVFVLVRAIGTRGSRVEAMRLAQLQHTPMGGAIGALSFHARVLEPLGRAVSRQLSALVPARTSARLADLLAAAGRPVTRGTLIAMLVILPGAVAGLGVTALASGHGLTPRGLLSMLAIAALFGVGGPLVWLNGCAKRRRAAITNQLPDALDLLVVSVEAGLGFDAAVTRVVETRAGVLSEELRRVLADLGLGTGRRAALQGLAARTRVPALDAVTAALIQADQTGMSIGQVLRAQAGQVRMQRRQHAQEAAMQAPLKMLFPLLFCIFPSLFIVILGPPMLSLMRTLGGR